MHYFHTNELMKIYSEKKFYQFAVDYSFKKAAVVSSMSHQFKRICCITLMNTRVSFYIRTEHK